MAATTYSPCSPSSGGAESHHGTPGTKLTDFSPEDFRGQSRMVYNGNSKTNHPPAFTLQGVPLKFSPHSKAPNLSPMGTQDPFTVTSSTLQAIGNTVSGIKLSPTAVAFKPTQSGLYSAGTLRSEPFPNSGLPLSFGQQPKIPQDTHNALGVSYLNATSVPDLDLSNLKLTQNISSIAGGVSQSPIGPPASGNYVLNSVFINLSSPTPKLVVISKLTTEGFIFVRFSDIRDAKQAYSTLKHTQTNWLMQFINVKYFVLNYKPNDLNFTSEFEGQILVTALCEGKTLHFNPQLIAHLVKEMLENYGDLMTFSIYSIDHPSITVRAEYYDVEAAEKAVMQLNGFKVSTYQLTVTHYAPDVVTSRANSTLKTRGPLIMGNGDSDPKSSFGNLNANGDHGRSYSAIYQSNAKICGGNSQGYISSPSPPGYTARDCQQNLKQSTTYSHPHSGITNPSWQACTTGPVGQQRMMPPHPQGFLGPMVLRQYGPHKNGQRHNHEYASGHHNVVDVERIRQGLDVRTTVRTLFAFKENYSKITLTTQIMLRNIPNKIDQAMLKEIVDDTSRGMYDFMYLRIDFANNCNVGYAFINFEDPYCIIDVKYLSSTALFSG
ncbi:hypothetical protein MMC34_006217 [Xylographa carneopallida]|nr:hypothetical protein [Xylographa carneopallida]